MQRLLSATYKADFFQLGEHFVQQVNGAYCGPASTCMVLNALGVARPLQVRDTGTPPRAHTTNPAPHAMTLTLLSGPHWEDHEPGF